MPTPLNPALARAAGSRAAMSSFGLDVAREEAMLAKKLHAAGRGAVIAQGLPGINPAQQSNLRKNYMQAMDLSADPRFGAFAQQKMKVGMLRNFMI